MDLFLTYIEAFFVRVNSFGYLSWVLSFNFMMGYWIGYYSNGSPGYISKLSIFAFLKNKTHRDYLKSTYFENPSNLKIFYINIVLLSMLISLVGSFVYLIILYKWFSIIFIILTMLITNEIGRSLDRKYDKEEFDELDDRFNKSWFNILNTFRYPSAWKEKLIEGSNKMKIDREEQRIEKLKLDNKKDLKNVTVLGCLSVICNFYAIYQILFNYYKL